MPVCKCHCHDASVMYCMELVCNCCKHHNMKYMDGCRIDAEKYATMIATAAVEKYRERNTYFEIEFYKKPVNKRIVDMVRMPLSFEKVGVDRFNR